MRGGSERKGGSESKGGAISTLERLQLIRAAARAAEKADAMFIAAKGEDARLAFGQQFDHEMLSILGLILSPDGQAALDRTERALGGLDLAVIPKDWDGKGWADLLRTHKAAQVARDVMRDRHPPMEVRDRASASYSRLCDRVMDVLDDMSVRLVLGRITMLLSQKEQEK